ncbi:MAG: hypothetical protein DWI03_08210 [Planctomycetota bacterium]|nr:MAG: hypothetical protein DWI03_08210 [Planctomycetota bacterium]
MNWPPGSGRLAALGAAAALLWCGVFPRLLQCPALARHIELMDRREVNPAAMYYTELEHLPLRPPWLERRVRLWPAAVAAMASPSGRE